MATGITPAMCMRLTGIGSQYIYAMRDSEGEYLDGARNYRLTLPPDIPESRFWSVILYDNQTRSMLQTDQHLPRLGSQSGTVETNADGSTDIYFGPTAPEGKEDNWLQTVPGKGWWTILRLYNPLQPFFDKTWRPSEIEPRTDPVTHRTGRTGPTTTPDHRSNPVNQIDHPTVDERKAAGKAARDAAKPRAHAGWKPADRRPDAVGAPRRAERDPGTGPRPRPARPHDGVAVHLLPGRGPHHGRGPQGHPDRRADRPALR